jgi:hypothetical protein
MGGDKIRHVLFLKKAWRWRPTAKMRAEGFKMITLGQVRRHRPSPRPRR